MPRKIYKPEVLAKLCHVEVRQSVVDAIRSIAVMDPTYYRLRAEYGGLKLDQVERLKELEAENTRLREAVSDLTLEQLIRAGRVLSHHPNPISPSPKKNS